MNDQISFGVFSIGHQSKVFLGDFKVKMLSARISAWHPMEVPPTEPAAMKIWRRASANVLSE
jgi:hypothetical protein